MRARPRGRRRRGSQFRSVYGCVQVHTCMYRGGSGTSMNTAVCQDFPSESKLGRGIQTVSDDCTISTVDLPGNYKNYKDLLVATMIMDL